MVFFCHGTAGSTWNSHQNNRRHLNKNKNHEVRKIRARAKRYPITSPTSKCSCATTPNLSTGHSEHQSTGGGSQKLQEETETDELNAELKDQTSLEQVPFEIIEAEDILLWGCPPHKIPRVAKSGKSKTRVSMKKAASNPNYYNTCHSHRIAGSRSERFDYEACNDFSTDFDDQCKQTSDHEFNANIPREFSWSSFNPFEDFESFNDFQSFLFPQLFKSQFISCEIYDVPVEADKAVVLMQTHKPLGAMRDCKSHAPIIHEYTSEDEDANCGGRSDDSGSLVITEMKSCGEETAKHTILKKKSEFKESIPHPEPICSGENTVPELKDTQPPQTKVLFEGVHSRVSSTESPDITILEKQHECCSKPVDIFDVRIIHSLPGMFTVYNVETNSFPGKSQETRRKHRRKKALSVAITDQCHQDVTEEQTQVNSEVLTEQPSVSASGRKKLVACDRKSTAKSENETQISSNDFSMFSSLKKETNETVELFRTAQLLSSSSKILPKIQSALTIHLRTRSSPSIPSSGTLLSFSPAESFVSSVETSPVKLDIEDDLLARSQDGLLQSFYPESSESIDEENFCKFYPPPTPLSKSSILKCKPLEKQNSGPANPANVEPDTWENQSQCHGHNHKKAESESNNSCIICNQVFLHYQQGDETSPENQKPVLKKSHNKKVSSVKFKVDQKKSQNVKPLTVSSSLLTTDTELPEIQDIEFLKHGIPSVSSTGPDAPTKFAIPKSPRSVVNKLRSRSSTKLGAIDDDCNNNITDIPKKSPLRTSLAKRKQVKPVSALIKGTFAEDITAEESTEVIKMGNLKQTSSSSATKTSRSSKHSHHDRLKNGTVPKVTYKNDRVHLNQDATKAPTKKADKGRKLSPSNRKARSRRRNKPHRKTNSSNSSCEDESDNFRRKAGLKKEHDRRRFYRNIVESSTDRSLSSDSKTYQQRRRRRKKRRKQNLWQKMIQYFFGCECHSKAKASYSSLRESDSSTNGYYGPDYKPQISFFERIVIWWRRKTHREIVVRQDSVQMFRIKRRRWLREIHEFYEDLSTVSKNVRQAEKKRSKNKPRYRNPPIAKMVNSEGCILLRNQGVRIDTLNGNKPKEKKVDPKHAKGILKNTNNLPSKHISYK